MYSHWHMYDHGFGAWNSYNGGWQSSTRCESAAVAVVYAFIVESLIHKEMNWDDLRDVIRETTKLLGSLFPVLMIALSLNVFLTYEEVPQNLVAWMSDKIDNPVTALLTINIFLILMM